MQVLLASDISTSTINYQAVLPILLGETLDGCVGSGTRQPYLNKAVIILRGNCTYSVKARLQNYLPPFFSLPNTQTWRLVPALAIESWRERRNFLGFLPNGPVKTGRYIHRADFVETFSLVCRMNKKLCPM